MSTLKLQKSEFVLSNKFTEIVTVIPHTPFEGTLGSVDVFQVLVS